MNKKHRKTKRSLPGRFSNSNNTDCPKQESMKSKEDKLHTCTKCQVYFVNYLTAKQHFDNFHSIHLDQKQAKKKIDPHKGQRNSNVPISSSKPEDILMPVLLPELRVSLAKLPHPSLSQRSSSSKNITRSKNLEKKNDEADSVEIKLDDLKASEIETLLKDMFRISSGPPAPASAVSSTLTPAVSITCDIAAPRRSDRKAKRRFEHNKNFEDGMEQQTDFSDDENEPKRRKRKKKITHPEEDPDFSPNPSEMPTSTTDSLLEEKEHEITSLQHSFLCRLCHLEYHHKRLYYEHMKQTHTSSDGSYSCRVCLKKIISLQKFTQHVRIHDTWRVKKTVRREKKGPFECSQCHKMLKYNYSYVAHMNRHEQQLKKNPNRLPSTTDRLFPCPLCPTKCSRSISLKRHFTKHLETNPFKCRFQDCKAAFGDHSQLLKHDSNVHSKTGQVFQCLLCPSQFSTPHYLKNHINEKHRGVSYPVQSETLNNGNADTIDEHDEVSAPIPPTTTTLLNSVDIKADVPYDAALNGPSDKLDIKYRVELESIHIEDRIMEEEFNDDDDGQNELESELGLIDLQNKALVEDPVVIRLERDNPEGFKLIEQLVKAAKKASTNHIHCKLCRWNGLSPVYYEKHMKRVHDISEAELSNPSSGEVSLICGTCGYKSSSAEDLESHIKSHIGQRKYPCLKCGLRFSEKSRLQRHEKVVHGTAKKFPCKRCPVVCSTKESLLQHLRRHKLKDKGMTFKCPVCFKLLASNSGLTVHMNGHSEKDPRRKVCQICKSSFATIDVLKRHIRIVHTKTLDWREVISQGKKRRREKMGLQQGPKGSPSTPESSSAADSTVCLERMESDEIIGF